MNLLSLSLDPLVLQKESVVASRSIRYGEVLESYSIIVPAQDTATVQLSKNTFAHGTGGSNKLVQLWNMYRRARVIIKENKCDVISSQDTYFLGLLAWVLSRQYHLGLEVQVLGIEKLSFFRKALSKFVLTRAGSIRVLSLGLKKRLVQEFGISEVRMKLVPIYVDVSSLGFDQSHQSSDEKATIESQNALFQKAYAGRFNIISVNRLVPIKNIAMQLQAIEVLSSEFPDILLHIIGDGALQAELETEIRNRGIENHVVLEGFKSGATLSPFFTQSDCFVLTSDFEGYGMVVVEAATAGLPIVMTDVGCAGEVIINEKSGMIVPPRDTSALIQALRRVIADTSLRETLRQGARESVAQLPSFDRVLENYKASWQQALDNR